MNSVISALFYNPVYIFNTVCRCSKLMLTNNRSLDSESQDISKLGEIMKNVDKDGHTILYPASQNGKAGVLELIMEQKWWEELLEEEKGKKDWVLFAGNVCASGATSLAKKILEKDRGLLEKRENECEKKCDGKCVTILMR